MSSMNGVVDTARFASAPKARSKPLDGPFLLFCAILVWSPLPLASNRPALWAINAALVAILLAYVSIGRGRAALPRAVPLSRIGIAAAAFFLVMGWMAIQALPAGMPQLHHSAWEAARAVLGGELAGAISIAPAETATMMLRYATYGAFFWCGLQLTRSWRRACVLIRVVFISAIAYAVYGLVLNVLQSETILWFDKWAYTGSLTSTFVNRNSAAAFFGCGAVAGLALLFRQVGRAGRNARGGPMSRWILIVSTLVSTGGLAIAGLLVLCVALVLTGSRAGLMASTAAMIVFAVLQSLRARGSGGGVAVPVLFLAALLASALALGGGLVAERFLDTGESWEVRQLLFRASVEAMQNRPWLGYGAGTFTDAFGLYVPDGLAAQYQFQRAHNTYLELAIELGLPAAAVLLAGVAAIQVRLFSGYRNRRDRYWLPGLALSVSLLFGLHSLVDFPLQIQAVTFQFLAVLAAGVAQSWSRGDLVRATGKRVRSAPRAVPATAHATVEDVETASAKPETLTPEAKSAMPMQTGAPV